MDARRAERGRRAGVDAAGAGVGVRGWSSSDWSSGRTSADRAVRSCGARIEATGRSRPNIYRQTTRHEVAVSAVSARYIDAGFAWRRDDRPEYVGGHQADGVAIGMRTSELIEVELTAKRAPRYASIFSAYRRRLELGDCDRVAYLCTDGAARAVRTALKASPAGRAVAPRIGVRAVFDERGTIRSPARMDSCRTRRRSCSTARGRSWRRSRRTRRRGKRYRVRYRDRAHQSREKAGFRGRRRPRSTSPM